MLKYVIAEPDWLVDDSGASFAAGPFLTAIRKIILFHNYATLGALCKAEMFLQTGLGGT